MTYYHYSDKDRFLSFIERQEKPYTQGLASPRGFWITDDEPGNWKQWCKDENFA